MRKIYKSVNSINYITTVIVEGKEIEIKFKGNINPRRHGTYQTSDEALQRAIESDSTFGGEIICVGAIGCAKTDRIEKKYNSDAATDNAKPVVVVDGIKNKQLAIEHLATIGVDIASATKAEEVKRIASEHNISYPDWP